MRNPRRTQRFSPYSARILSAGALDQELENVDGFSPASSPGSLLRGLHHRFLHTVFSRPIQANLVAIGIVEVGMPPTPGHHAWQLGDVKPFSLEIAAKVVELSDFEIQTHSVAQNGNFRTRLV